MGMKIDKLLGSQIKKRESKMGGRKHTVQMAL